jgi:hypothetical protein
MMHLLGLLLQGLVLDEVGSVLPAQLDMQRVLVSTI